MLPKGYYPEDVEEDVELPSQPKEGMRPMWRRALPVAVAFGALAGFSGLLLATYFSADGGIVGGPTPLITADARPYKTRPDNPGGMDVPHQDIEIFNRVQPGLSPSARAGETAQAPRVERLLPPPDQPLPRPSAAPPVLQPEIPAAPQVAPPPDAVEVPTARRLVPPSVIAPVLPQSSPPQIVLRQPVPVPTPQRDQVAAVPPATPQLQLPAQGALPAALPGFRVQLGVMRSADEAQREWQRLQSNHGDLIGRLSVAYPRSGGRYRIQAGPLLTSAGATQLCRRLGARGVGCVVVKP